MRNGIKFVFMWTTEKVSCPKNAIIESSSAFRVYVCIISVGMAGYKGGSQQGIGGRLRR